MKRQLKLSTALKLTNMKGGGYSNFLDSIRKDSNTNCIAKFIIIDGDRAIDDVNEKEQLRKLLEYCIIQNKSERTPHFLIINCPNFEYIACLHVPTYHGKSVSQFIVNELKYRNIDEFKSDTKVYDVLNTRGNSVEVMLTSLKRTNSFVINKYSFNKGMFSMSVKTTYNWSKLECQGSNINEFFEIVLGD
jgi:hypothetical protein